MATDTTLIAQRRTQLRLELLARREVFACDPHFATSEAALLASLESVLQQLETQCLGLYWPIRGEFNASLLGRPDHRPAQASLVPCQGSNAACSLALKPDGVVASRRHSPSYDSSSRLASGLDGGAIKRHLSPDTTLALPFAQRSPLQMHYRLWDGTPPSLRDECGIPSVDTQPIVPDVVLVPCVGFTRTGHRLGFGAGYFDRWMAAHPHVTAVGVAWSFCEITDEDLAPQPHDQALMAVVTERGVVS